MTRKKWQSKTEITPSLIKFREKRKWQIALRRYVLEQNICFDYAPYFGLDIQNIRKWFEYQFKEQLSWEDFGKKWQFDHIIPVTYFDFGDKEELKMCWNFTNIRVEYIQSNKDRTNRLDVIAAKKYFQELFSATGYDICNQLLDKITRIELSDFINTEEQRSFLKENNGYLEMIQDYTAFDFELLNRGRKIEEVEKEREFLKKFGQPQAEGN